MVLEHLLNIHARLDWREQNQGDKALGVTSDSRQVKLGWVFVAAKTATTDGHIYIDKAISAGAAALVVSDEASVPKTFKGVVAVVLDTNWAQAELLKRYYEHPHEQLTSIGITGTNGKTSCSYITEHILNSVGLSCGVMGTIDHHIGETSWESALTTPTPATFFSRLRDFVDHGAKSFVMEVSSHGLKQRRVPIDFDVAVFTNFSRDHLDYHPDMQDYFASKALLFSEHLKKEQDSFVILNADESAIESLQVPDHATQLFFSSQKQDADFYFSVQKLTANQSVFTITHSGQTLEMSSPLVGEHNVSNCVASIAAVSVLGVSLRQCQQALKTFIGIPGRLQKIEGKGLTAFVDYAHTPDALEKALQTLNDLKTKHNISQSQLWCVFGCGGERDAGKRPEMARVAERLSDHVVVTSDNPRGESPEAIIEDIFVGFDKTTKAHRETDRRQAIEHVAQSAQPGDLILIAGKGHECTQKIGDLVLPFSDLQVLQDLLT